MCIVHCYLNRCVVDPNYHIAINLTLEIANDGFRSFISTVTAVHNECISGVFALRCDLRTHSAKYVRLKRFSCSRQVVS